MIELLELARVARESTADFSIRIDKWVNSEWIVSLIGYTKQNTKKCRVKYTDIKTEGKRNLPSSFISYTYL